MAKRADKHPDVAGSGLSRRLGLTTATALIVGEVIGVGIFLTPAAMAKSLGSPFWMLVVWVTMGASAIGGALCFGALSTRYPEAGGPYVYLREAYGARVAFLYGWISLLVTDPGVTASVAVGLARYVGYLSPLTPWGQKGAAVVAIAVLAAINMLGVSLGASVLRALAALKLGLLGFLVLWGFSFGRGDWANLSPFWTQRPGSETLAQALTVGLIYAFVSFGGWWDASKLAGDMRDPKRTLPRALVLGVSIVTVVYISISVVFLYLVPSSRIASDEAFAALAGEALFGPPGGKVFASIVIVSVTGSLSAMLMASPRVYYAMARDGLFLSAFAAVDPSRGTPARAVALQAALAMLLAVTGTYEEILAFLMVPTLVLLVMTVFGVFVLRRRSPLQAPVETPGFPVSPLVFIVPTLALVVMLIARNPIRAVVGLAVVLVGILVGAWVVGHKRPKVSTDDSPPLAQQDHTVPTIDLNS
jgi:APA family basic amino acid/polyamine antiporter